MNALRWQTAIAHSGVLLWQVYSASTAWRSGALLENLLHGIGATTGPGVSLFLATCRWWFVVNIWWREAWFGPIFSLIRQVG